MLSLALLVHKGRIKGVAHKELTLVF